MNSKLLEIIESYINGNISYALEELKQLDGEERAELVEVAQEYFGNEVAFKLAKSGLKAL